jgi:HlyD family secretion protein
LLSGEDKSPPFSLSGDSFSLWEILKKDARVFPGWLITLMTRGLYMNRFIKRGISILLILIALVLIAWWFLGRESYHGALFRTEKVKRGDLVATISATGTVEPEEVIDVGAQVAGQIVAFGKDKFGKTIDYGSIVEEGTVLARIDDSIYAADVAQAKAQLAQARAGVMRAEADLRQLQAKLKQAERDWRRAEKIGPSDALSQSDFDAALSNYEVAEANVEVGKAAIVQAKGAVAQAEATLARAQRNLDYCVIKSPVKGVIIDRRVNIGQTVVASLNAPSLFLLAKDLKRMQVWIAVNEADIGSIKPGQPVTFTVDAYPGQTFRGEVGKVRLNATMTQNVVTYTVEVITDNSSGRLLPYLTANAKFILGERSNVLLVPNAALRWTPLPEQMALNGGKRSEMRSIAEGTSLAETSSQDDQGKEGQGTVWVLQGSLVKPVRVHTGLTDGTFTEVQSPELEEGGRVVLGELSKEETSGSTAVSPFTPQPFKRSRTSSRQ